MRLIFNLLLIFYTVIESVTTQLHKAPIRVMGNTNTDLMTDKDKETLHDC